MRPLIAFLADDFTGATDVIVQATRLHRTATLFVNIPTSEQLRRAAETSEVIGIASVIRSWDPENMAPFISEAFDRFALIDPLIVQYKICSTADSSPERGSIKPAVDAARARFGCGTIPILVAQPSLGRYTAFSHHFARDSDGVHRLDRNPAMANHPATPMRESDLRVHFEAQLDESIGDLHVHQIRDAGVEPETEAIYVVDAVTEDDLSAAARSILARTDADHPRFMIGSGGLTLGLLDQLGGNTASTQSAAPSSVHSEQRRGPILAVSGSGAPETSRQMDAAAKAGWELIPLDVAADPATLIDRIHTGVEKAAASLREDRSCVVFTTHDTLAPRGSFIDAAVVGGALGEVILRTAEATPVDRVIIAGGDTSGYVMTSLQATRIDAAGTVSGDLLLAAVHSTNRAVEGLEIVLKGGQLGPRDVFERARVTPTAHLSPPIRSTL